MCGILGCLGLKIEVDQFNHVLRGLHHRGPYDMGTANFLDAHFGMTRLPMSSNEKFALPVHKGKLTVTYNGEVYKKGGLDLIGEVNSIITGIQENCFPDGMYAFSVFDEDRDTLYIGRDRFGIKPLYYYHDSNAGQLLFCSEIKPLLDLVGPLPLDRDALADVVATGVTLDYQTLFKGIQLLPPATLLKASRQLSGQLLIEVTKMHFATDELDGDLESLLEHSVALCSNTFRDVGILLSGGLDSNLIRSFMPETTVKFHVAVEKNEDTPPLVSRMNICWLREQDFWDTLEKAVENFAAPTRMSSILMYQKLAELVAAHDNKCVLLGEGADELFLGYPRHLDLFSAGAPISKDVLQTMYFGDVEKMAKLLSIQHSKRVNERVASIFEGQMMANIEELVAKLDIQYSLEPLLRRADHLLMSHTIESRLPYLHNGIPAFAKRLGTKNFMDNRQKNTLAILAARRLPQYIQQQKRHFRIPFSEWPDVLNQMRHFLQTNLQQLQDFGVENLSTELIRSLDSTQLFVLTTLSIWINKFERRII